MCGDEDLLDFARRRTVTSLGGQGIERSFRLGVSGGSRAGVIADMLRERFCHSRKGGQVVVGWDRSSVHGTGVAMTLRGWRAWSKREGVGHDVGGDGMGCLVACEVERDMRSKDVSGGRELILIKVVNPHSQRNGGNRKEASGKKGGWG